LDLIMPLDLPEHWTPVIQSAAGTIIGIGVVGTMAISARLWWSAKTSEGRWICFWWVAGALAAAAVIIWLALFRPSI
jgi:hypothetical protein